MPGDRVQLRVAGQVLERWLSYRIESDLYTADDAFHLELAGGAAVAPGARCELWVNDQLEMTGLVDRVVESGERTNRSTVLEGRDLMGLLVDSYCEEFFTVEGFTLKQLAERLLKKVPFIQRKSIQYQQNVVGRLKKKKGKAEGMALLQDEPQAFGQVEPGRTVFDVLSEYARSRGLLFYSLPDGTFVFGRPKAKGEAAYRLFRKKSGEGNNVLSGTRVRDVSRRYSKITVLSQQQGTDEFEPEKISISATVTDPDAPFYKPLVIQKNADSQSPAEHARWELERQRFAAEQLTYQLSRHSLEGRNFTVNELAWVEDEALGVRGTYLVYGRTLVLGRQEGTITELRLGPPGLAA